MGSKKTSFDAEAASVFRAPAEAPRAIVIRNMWEGDFVFLLGGVPTEYIDMPTGFIDTEEEIHEARIVLDQLQALKLQIREDQKEDLQFIIDDLAGDVHWAEAAWAELEAESAKIETILAHTARPRDDRGRFVRAN